MTQVTAFLHDGTIGDVIASLPAINEYYRKTGNKAVLYLTNGQEAIYYKTAIHPTTDPFSKKMVMLNEPMINMLAPLLKAQECIADAKMHSNQPIQIDLNRIRQTFTNIPNGCISRWYFYVFPDLACDLSKVWLTVPDTDKDLAKGKIIVTRTERYINPQVNYTFLKKYEKDILFSGTELEYQIFKLRFNLDIERIVVKDFLELAQAIKQSRFHLSNQTMAFQISSGLKHPRIVELCDFAQNVIPVGEDAFDFFAQEAAEYYVDYLFNKSEKAAK